MFHIRKIDVHSEFDFFSVASLRYKVFVNEMRLDMRYADHLSRTVIEPLDSHSHIFAAFENGKAVASLRVTFVREADVGDYFDGYGLQKFAGALDTVSLTTRLMIDNAYRNTRLALQLPMHAYKFALKNGITHNVIDCRPKLQSFFSKLGGVVAPI